MSVNDDLERRIADHCAMEAPRQAPDWVLGSALATIEMKRQRRERIRVPWRFADMNAYTRLATAAVAVIAVGSIGLAVGAAVRSETPSATPTPSVEPLWWTPERLSEDWPAPVRLEPMTDAAVMPMELGDNAQWDAAQGGWDGFEFADPVGDVDPAVAWIDIREAGLNPLSPPAFGIELASVIPRPVADPSTRWIAYGFVLDTDRDGAPDVRIGIDNLPDGYRAWRTDLASGQTQAKARPPYAWVGERNGGTGPGPTIPDFFYPGDGWAPPEKAGLWYAPQPGEQDFRFYAWASVIEGGRVVATDYAPDQGWLEEGAQPGLPLVGTTWTVGADLPDGSTSIEATVAFTADGGIVVDACRVGTGTVTAEGSTLRISGLSLTESTCTLPGTTEFDAAIWAVLSKPELTYTIEKGVLELRAGQDVLRLQGTTDGPPG